MKKIFLMLSAAMLLTTFAFAQTPIYSNDFTGGSTGWSFTGGNAWEDMFTVNSVYSCGEPPNTPDNSGGNYLHVAGSDWGTGELCAHAQYTFSGSAGNSYAEMSSSFSTSGFTSVTITFDWLSQGNDNGGFLSPTYGEVAYSLTGLANSWVTITNPKSQYLNQTSWTKMTITSTNVPALLNQPKVYLRFGWVNGGIASGHSPNPAFSIDNISVTGTGGGVTCDLSANMNHADVGCKGDFTGTASVTPTGGTAPYTYSWNPGGNGPASKSSLSAGFYFVTVKDANGCSATTSVEIKEPVAELSALAEATDATCGRSNGSIDVAVDGGTSPYTYLWSIEANSQHLGDLPADDYSVVVMDAHGCSIVANATVNNIAAPSLSETHINAACGNPSGSINLTVDGGTSPFTYLWSNNSTEEDQIDLVPNKYFVDVTDANGCTASKEIDINSVLGSCGVPEGVGSSNITSSSAFISWAEEPCAYRFRIRYRPINAPTWAVIVTGGGVYSKMLGGLTASTEYEVQIAARCSETTATFTNWSASQFFTTNQKCDPPTGIGSTPVNRNRVTVSWTAVPGAYSYDVAYRIVGNIKWARKTVLAPVVSQLLFALTPNSEYEYEVRTHCGVAGKESSGWSALLNFTTSLRIEEGLSATDREWAIYPNPSKGNFNIVLSVDNPESATLEITNTLGQVVFTELLNLSEGVNTFSVNIPNAVTGIYLVSVKSSGMTLNRKVMMSE